MSDGSTLILRGGNSNYLFEIFYDVNGIAPPNRWGYDLFEFDGLGENIYPNGLPNMPETFDKDCASKDSLGYGCTAWVIFKENMDYLKCEGLSWNGKQRCN